MLCLEKCCKVLNVAGTERMTLSVCNLDSLNGLFCLILTDKNSLCDIHWLRGVGYGWWLVLYFYILRERFYSLSYKHSAPLTNFWLAKPAALFHSEKRSIQYLKQFLSTQKGTKTFILLFLIFYSYQIENLQTSRAFFDSNYFSYSYASLKKSAKVLLEYIRVAWYICAAIQTH